MEAAPRLPMISFELKTSTEIVSFGPRLKQYIASFYHEDPESYNNEIHNLESLRASAVRPAIDVVGVQTLKKYYCQLNFLKSRFPLEKGQSCAVSFSWKDLYAGHVCSVSDIDFELSSILYNIGALHTQLGALDARSSSEGMKMSCSHFQCAAWAFQHLKESYSQLISLSLAPEVVHFMYQLCLAQAQECILEKSMMDNRKATIIAKVAVQVVDYYNQAISTLMSGTDDGTMGEIIGSRVFKDWSRYLKFKVAYNSCVSLLYQGQQAEEAQKMGERVAYYQAASELLEEARKIAKGLAGQQQNDVDEALGFTQDVVEGKKKAAKNENEFIYHEVVPEKDALQQINGASLVKGIPFSVNDPDVSGTDLFQRLVPMEAHEASSVYSEQKAEMLRQVGAIVDTKDSELAEFMSSLQLDCLTQFRHAVGVPQDVVDRAAAICAKPQATQALVEVMGKLAGICHEVESLLGEIQELIKEEEIKEQEYQKIMGSRPPSIVSTDLTREAGKYSEAHSKANESNQTLHRAMTMHMANLKVLAQPLSELKKTIPCAVPNDSNIDDSVLNELETLITKVDEMKAQRAGLVAQLREGVCNDDITALLVTKPADMTMEQLFQKELAKHKRQVDIIEQNLAAQDNILSALTDVYAKFAPTRRYIIDVLKRREQTTAALIASYDAYDDLLAKANKGIEFYQKLEGNVSKLLQRVKSACKVNEEERDQMLAKSGSSVATSSKINQNLPISNTPKLKDYLASMRNTTPSKETPANQWLPPSVRPTPLGSEEPNEKRVQFDTYSNTNVPQTLPSSYPYPLPGATDYYQTHSTNIPASINVYPAPNMNYPYPNISIPSVSNPPSTFYQTADQNYQNSIANTLVVAGSTYYQTPDQNYQNPASNTTPSVANPPPNYYQTPEQNYQIPTTVPPASSYYQTPDKSYQVPSLNYAAVPAVSNPPSTYYQKTDKNYQIPASNTTSISVSTYYQTPEQSYQIPAGYQYPNFQNPSYSNLDSSYTPASTPQQNYTTPAAYSPCLDTSAPSQKMQQDYQHPSNYKSSSDNYNIAENPALNSGLAGNLPYQNNVPVGYNNYPVQDSGNAYNNNQYLQQQYQAPNEEYQQQYQYIPQYYSGTPTHNNASHQADQINSTNYYTVPYGYQTPGQNPMTMMQSNNNSGTVSKATSSASSNVDLLAGLDFSINQAPLQPEIKPSGTNTSDQKSTTKSTDNTPVKTRENSPIAKVKTEVLKKEEPKEEQLEVQIEDPLGDPETLNNFMQEVEKLEKFVDGLTIKTLNGPTPLDLKWKDIQEQQDRDSQHCSISVARCYPMKNRFPDIMPYDQFRVELPSTKDDYINASHVKSASKNSPPFIVTQAPLKSTLDDFWTMIWKQQVEVIVCLLGEAEMQQEASVYWPVERGSELTIGKFRIVLQTVNNRENWIERIISVNDGTKSLVVVHIQFISWPGGGLFPTTVFPVISLASAVLACFRQQRIKSRPILVHCLSGLGRSGVLCVLIAAMCDPVQMLDVSAAVCRISRCRKNILRDREHLKFAYQAVLQHLRDLLSGKNLQNRMQEMTLTDDSSSRRSSVSSEQSSESKTRKKFTPDSFTSLKEQGITSSDISDPLSALDPLWTMKK